MQLAFGFLTVSAVPLMDALTSIRTYVNLKSGGFADNTNPV